MNYAPFIRIFLRYGAMFLATKGVLDQATASDLANNVDLVAALEMLVGTVVAVITEAWHMRELRKQQSEKANVESDPGKA